MDKRTKEAVRYLGYGTCAVDEKVLQLIQESFLELEKIANPRCVYRIFEISFPSSDCVSLGNLNIESRNLVKNLSGCKEAVLLGATLGTEVDRQIHKYEVLHITKAVVLQACATAYLEEYLDDWQKTSGYKRARFSPGYGDFSISFQKELLRILDTSKQIGLSVTEGYMLTPTKSVTAVIGVGNEKENCEQEKCQKCEKVDCSYRRSER